MNFKDFPIFFLWWFVLSAFWYLLIEKATFAEMAIGLSAAFLTALIQLTVAKTNLISLKPRLVWLFILIKLPVAILLDTFLVFKAIGLFFISGKKPRGHLDSIPFERIKTNSLKRKIDRTFFIYTFSVTPNTYVIYVDRKNRKVLIHKLMKN
ncbi:hypothetical protein [Legionella oakridgensis]|uniref:Multisubunit Na+/H+ antiporter, MnhE subunit n=2 Tax=Legionella oakridgensis TaxID=29423 RepID=W0BEW8_9GAMM|nr:hypothetical protein [Legionella oakridgensis]AHE67231.1 hypothetical protein Loa_01684 [Legionella oakridgensis ATCC 33761 = DSM 21215]ETO93194.1 hypothetical protein LOR_48c09260 [Legionella oakridgensis RV-2-2007]KTD37971.1 hypothetical protein Loak_1647 [Legionella oakridgensis]STY20308.1 Uncharacterised protein [Legionella longbeachae]